MNINVTVTLFTSNTALTGEDPRGRIQHREAE